MVKCVLEKKIGRNNSIIESIKGGFIERDSVNGSIIFKRSKVNLDRLIKDEKFIKYGVKMAEIKFFPEKFNGRGHFVQEALQIEMINKYNLDGEDILAIVDYFIQNYSHYCPEKLLIAS